MTSERIEKVINFKGLAKEQLEIEARQRREELRAEREKLESLEKLFNETVEKFMEKHGAGLLDTNEISMFYDYIAYMENQIKEQRRTVKEKSDILIEKEKEVIIAHREKRLLEILHDNIIKKEIRETFSREQKDMDLDFIMRRLRR